MATTRDTTPAVCLTTDKAAFKSQSRQEGPKTFFSLSGEVRNLVYDAFFDDLPEKGQFGYSYASWLPQMRRFAPYLNLLLANRALYHEAGSLFYQVYFPRFKYCFNTLADLQHFMQRIGYKYPELHGRLSLLPRTESGEARRDVKEVMRFLKHVEHVWFLKHSVPQLSLNNYTFFSLTGQVDCWLQNVRGFQQISLNGAIGGLSWHDIEQEEDHSQQQGEDTTPAYRLGRSSRRSEMSYPSGCFRRQFSLSRMSITP